jgi:hypothetical protein
MRARALLAFLAVGVLFGSSPLQADPVHQWSKRFGDSASGPQGGNAVAIDAFGNVILLGAFVGTVDFGGGPLTNTSPSPFALDIFLAKFDANGGYLWSHRFGDVGTEYGSSVAVDSFGAISITGSFEGTVDFGGGPLTSAGGGDIFLAHFDANGNHRWSYHFGDGRSRQNGNAVAADTFNDVILTGGFDGTVSFGGPPLASASDSTLDIFVAKFNVNGVPMWSKRFGDVDSIPRDADVGNAVVADHLGNILLAGSFDGSVDFGGGALVSPDSTSSFFVKLDGSGNHIWSRSFGDFGFSRASSGVYFYRLEGVNRLAARKMTLLK